ncbi:MAG: phosphoglucomutase/phosphomannomutase family protein [Candidatus Polarisedimenticolia bacterium]
MTIRFGTDGWRAIIADQFTFENVRRVAAAVERAIPPEASDGAPVVVGYDTRFHSRRFAEAVAGTLLAAGRRVQLSDAPCPTPAVSCQVVREKAPFAIVITASHNPARFNGVKVKDSSGSSADEEITRACEQNLPAAAPACLGVEEGLAQGRLSIVSFSAAHEDRLARMVDLPAIREAGLTVVADPMYGAGGRLLERLLSGGRTRVITLHAETDPLFGGLHPEPLEQHLGELRAAVAAHGADAGLATDGDADRIGAFDEAGQFVSPLRIAPLLALGLIRKGRRGPLGKTFANTILLDRIARRHGLPFSTFPVGFKHIAREMRAGRMLLGGEESGGIGVEGYIPERDGTLVSLMILQAMVDEGKPLSRLVREMTDDLGELHYRRRDLVFSPDTARRVVERLRENPPSMLGGMAVTGLDDRDGLKLLFGEEGWILFRGSGTEPVLRVYCEAPSPEALDGAMTEALHIVDRISFAIRS